MPSPLVPVLALIASSSLPVQALELEAGPYVQHVTADGAWIMWKGEQATSLAWGTDTSLDHRSWPSGRDTGLQAVRLRDLQPDTTYLYALEGRDDRSATHAFHTAPEGHHGDTRFLVISDSQEDFGNRDIFDDFIGRVTERLWDDAAGELSEHLDFVLLTGDLVDDGTVDSEWTNDFLRPSQELMAAVPLYAVLGNHELDSSLYFDYLQLPRATSEGEEEPERWYRMDRNNIRLLALDSNEPWTDQAQLDWLDRQLEETCSHPSFDFVVAAYHHPPLSEIWPDGQAEFSQTVVERLDAFAAECNKPVVSFFGHAHGYSRGQSRDATHLLFDAASISGPLHQWGQLSQLDHPEIAVTFPEYGYLLVHAWDGEQPGMTIERALLSADDPSLDHAQRDLVTVRRFGDAPGTPSAVVPLDSEVRPYCAQLAASPWDQVHSEPVVGSHWQVAEGCDRFDEPVWEQWHQDVNHFNGLDRRADAPMESAVVPALEPERELCWRVRYRGSDLDWSGWSEPAGFATSSDDLGDNLLVNSGIEQGVDGWEVLEGPLQVIESGECDAIEPRSGANHLGLCGACLEGYQAGRITQQADLEAWADDIDTGGVVLRWGGWSVSSSGLDYVTMAVMIYDADGVVIGDTESWTQRSSEWSRTLRHTVLPAGARAVSFDVATVNVQYDSDCSTYVHALELRIEIDGRLDDCVVPPGLPDPNVDTGSPDSPVEIEDTQIEDSGCPGGDCDTDDESEVQPPDPKPEPRSCGLAPTAHRSALLSALALALTWLLIRVRRYGVEV